MQQAAHHRSVSSCLRGAGARLARPHVRSRRSRCPAASQEAAAATPTAAAAAATPAAAAAAAEEHPAEFAECVETVLTLGFDELAAATCVQRAFGWGAKVRSYWRREKSQQPPDPEQVLAVLAFLRQELEMDDLACSKTVKAFPEVLGCSLDGQLRVSVAKLQSEWRLEGDVLRKAVLRNPSLLGYNVDCMGDCAGECNRCWARF